MIFVSAWQQARHRPTIILRGIQKHSTLSSMNSQYIKKLNLPDLPGVYIFRDSQNRPLYIGRATSLCDRVKSYFSNDLIETRGPRVVDMVTRSAKLSNEKTDSVLEAIILESNLIKKYQPRYNIDEKDDKSSVYIVITKEKWPRVFTVRERDWNKEGNSSAKVFGPYPQAGLVNVSLKILRKIFPFKDIKAYDARHEAFYQSIGRSPSDQDEDARAQYIRTIRNLELFLSGKKHSLIQKLEREMKLLAKKIRFEEAQGIKRTIFALKHINDIALIKAQNNLPKNMITHELSDETGSQQRREFRIEAYDIAHLSGTNTVGSMVVSVNGEFQPKEYRTSKIIISF